MPPNHTGEELGGSKPWVTTPSPIWEKPSVKVIASLVGIKTMTSTSQTMQMKKECVVFLIPGK